MSTPTRPATGRPRRELGLLVLVILAVFVIYVVLGVLYESFIRPLTILSGLPFAAFGALLALYLFHIELSVFAFVRRGR